MYVVLFELYELGTCVVFLRRAQQRDNNQGLGTMNAATPDFGDSEYDMYRKRMMLAYRFRPNPLVSSIICHDVDATLLTTVSISIAEQSETVLLLRIRQEQTANIIHQTKCISNAQSPDSYRYIYIVYTLQSRAYFEVYPFHIFDVFNSSIFFCRSVSNLNIDYNQQKIE